MNRRVLLLLSVLAVAWGLAQALLARAAGGVLEAGGAARQVAAAAAVVAALALAASRSGLRGAPRAFALALLAWWVTWASSLVEAVVFDVIGGALLMPALGSTVVASAVLGVGVHAVLPPPEAAAAPEGGARSAWSVAARLALGVLIFTLCYLVAGVLAYPHVQEYYAGRAMPAPATVLGVQLVRGLALVLVSLPLLAQARDRGGWRSLRWAAVLVLLAAVAPMLPDNALMPARVRLVHGLEIAGAHLLVGLAHAALLGPRSRRVTQPGAGNPATG